MNAVILNHTWSVHSMSALAKALISKEIRQLEQDVVLHLPVSSSSNDEANYSRFSWIKPENDAEIINKEKEPSLKRKRKRNPDSGTEGLHLRIEMYLNEAKSAEIVFCYASLCAPPAAAVTSFDFCLVRGTKSTYEAVFRWFEQTTGCRIGRTPCPFSSEELALATSLWTHETAEKKPLNLVFAVPSHLQDSGLKTLTVTVPPASLAQFCQSMENARPTATNEASSFNRNLPILQALQAFILEAFHMDIASFQIVKASCAAASLSSDGRCKPQQESSLAKVLEFIYTTIKARSATLEETPEESSDSEEDAV